MANSTHKHNTQSKDIFAERLKKFSAILLYFVSEGKIDFDFKPSTNVGLNDLL